MSCYVCFFFFSSRRRHTSCGRDWSSDVCSSDLAPCPKCPPAKPAPETAQYLEFTFAGLPGWPSIGLERSLRTFLAGCPRSGAFAQVCARAASVPADDAGAARAFFEANFVPYAVV